MLTDHKDPTRLSGVFHGRYEIVRCIKAGGMGAVYEVIHRETRRRCALKVMLPSMVTDPEMRARFRLEATVTAEIESEHLVMVLDAGIDTETGAPFIVMELLKGEEVGEMIARRGPLPALDVIEILTQLARAIERTHAAGIIHRDLKPGNLFVTYSDDGTMRIKVLDFGIAKIVAVGTDAGQTRGMMGTPFYMAPEQISGRTSIGPEADLYAIGHIAYTLLTGEAYWKRDRGPDGIYGVLLKVVAGPVQPASVRAATRGVVLPPGFDEWFAKAVAVSPEHRFTRASELVSALSIVLHAPKQNEPRPPRDIQQSYPEVSQAIPSTSGGRSITAAVATVGSAPQGNQRSQPSNVLLASLLVLFVCALGAIGWFSVVLWGRAPKLEVTTAAALSTSAPAPGAPPSPVAHPAETASQVSTQPMPSTPSASATAPRPRATIRPRAFVPMPYPYPTQVPSDSPPSAPPTQQRPADQEPTLD